MIQKIKKNLLGKDKIYNFALAKGTEKVTIK